MTDTTESKSASNGGQYLFPPGVSAYLLERHGVPPHGGYPGDEAHPRRRSGVQEGWACRDLHPGWPRPIRCGVSQRHGDFHIRASFRRAPPLRLTPRRAPTLALPSSPEFGPAPRGIDVPRAPRSCAARSAN